MELFPKQEEFFYLGNKINLFCGGIQSSKTTTGALRFVAHGLTRYLHRDDNFIIAADTYKTLSQATIPTFLKFGSRLGRMNMGLMEFRLKTGGHIYFRTATDPESVEGIPNVRRVWLDEGGKVSLYFWENLEGRAARTESPIDVTTTPYSMNWLAKMGKAAITGKRKDVSVVHCRSIDSPYFSKNEYERQKSLLDPRRFAMKYEGEFGQMQGLVYDLYEQCLIKSRALPPGTVYYGGIDWGYFPDPFCLVVRAITPDRVHFRVAEYYKTHLIMSDITQVIKSFDGLYHFKMLYCDPSRPDSIAELNRSGLKAVGANNDLRRGIDVHYGLMKTNRFWIFEDRCPIGVDEYASYHYREERELGIEDDLKEKDRQPVDSMNHGCLSAGTLITMADGTFRRIETIAIGERVLTPLGPREVILSGQTGTKSILRVNLDDREIVATADHPILTQNGLRAISDCAIGDICISSELGPILSFVIKNIVGMASIGFLVGAWLMVGIGFIGRCGGLIAGKFQRVCIFTIKMVISTIIELRILNVSPFPTIYAGIPYLRKPDRSGVITWEKFGLSRLSGMDPQRGAHGMLHTGVSVWQPGKSRLRRVSIAGINLRRLAFAQNFARIIVSRLIAVVGALITKFGNASFVAKIFGLIGMRVTKHAVRSVAADSLPRRVYNLAVKDAGIYYANGVLVSNCDADRYVSMSLEAEGGEKRIPIVPEGGGRPTELAKRLAWLQRGGSNQDNGL